MAYIIGPIWKQSIYVIHDTIMGSVYVDKAKTDQLKEAYKRHRYGRRAMTKAIFENGRDGGAMPKMYFLEEVELTEQEAYHHVLAWARHFKESGYSLLCESEFGFQVENLNRESSEVYELIKQINIDDCLIQENELFANYGNQRWRSSDAPTVISFTVTEQEYNEIKKRADVVETSVSQFCKHMVLSGYIQHVDREVYSEVYELIDTFHERNNVLKAILLTIYRTGKYNPIDLEIIQKQTEENGRMQCEVMDRLLDALHLLQDDIRMHVDVSFEN